MDTSPAPHDDLSALGVDAGHHDGFGNWCTPSERSIDLIREAMGLEPGEIPPPGALVVVRAADGPPIAPHGRPAAVAEGTTVRLEDGTEVAVDGALPHDLPVGYHVLVDDRGNERPLVVSPGRCHLPEDLRIWGVTAQLYAARSERSWGIGDLGDLGRLAGWTRQRGGGLVGLNPLHAPTPSPDPPNSPYSPSSRRWRDPLMIAIEEVPGFTDLTEAADLAQRGRALNDLALIDRAGAWKVKRETLQALWARFRDSGGDADFDRYLERHGDGLRSWGTFCTIADDAARAGSPAGWADWPEELRRPDAPGVARIARDRADDVHFWSWLQWLVERQLTGAAIDDMLLTDLAVGFAADGFDAWEWQDSVALDARIGAPPDPLGPDGQDWGLPPFIPWRLSAAGYRPLAETMRSAFAHSRGVRIDHVMGLFRLFWIPPDSEATDGAYVRFHHHDLLHVLAVESSRAGGLVVGEDLGTVEDGVRESLSDAAVLSTRLLWFEDRPPQDWPRQAQAAVTTHDLPTVAGVWSGADLDDLRQAGVTLPDDEQASLRAPLRDAAGDDGATVEQVLVAAHRAVAGSPSVLATVALDDLVGARRRPNVPGTVDEHPNWRIPLPVPIDDLDGHPLAEPIAAAMSEGRRSPASP